MYSIFREKMYNQFGPFQETIIAREEVILISDVINLGDIPDAVKIEMIDGYACPGFILIDNGKCRALNDILHPKQPAKSFDKGCFTCSHATINSEYPSGWIGSDQLLCCRQEFCL